MERHDGDAYDKSFKSWDHLVTLIVCAVQPSVAACAAVEGTFNANSHHHYHLGVGKVDALDLVGCQ